MLLIQNMHLEWLHSQQALINWKLIQHLFKMKFKQPIGKSVKSPNPFLLLLQLVFQSKSNWKPLTKEKNRLEITEQKNYNHKKLSKQLDLRFLQHQRRFMTDWLELSFLMRVHFQKNQKDKTLSNKLKKNWDINILLLYYLRFQPSNPNN